MKQNLGAKNNWSEFRNFAKIIEDPAARVSSGPLGAVGGTGALYVASADRLMSLRSRDLDEKKVK